MTVFPATNLIVTAIFILCLATLAAGALMAVLTNRLIRSVCGLASSRVRTRFLPGFPAHSGSRLKRPASASVAGARVLAGPG